MNRFIIQPNNPLKYAWDLYVLALTILSAIVVPLQLAIHVPFHNSLLTYEIVVSISFGIDIVLQFFTGYTEHGHDIMDHGRIVRRYLRSWFAPDLIAALPFFLLQESEFAEAIPLIRSLRIIQMQRLFKLVRLQGLFRNLYRRHSAHPGLLRLSYFVLLMTLTAHWLSCGWILLGGITGEPDLHSTYIKALYFIVTTLASVGFGDIVPQNNLQRVYVICVMMLGVGSYGFVIGNLTSYLANRDIVRANHVKKLEEVTAFLRYRAIPADLREQVLAYYGHLWDSRMGPEESAVLADLPESLRVEIALSMRGDLLQKVPFFRGSDDDLLRDMVMALRPSVFLPGSYLMHEGDPGDSLYIISSGSVEIVSRDGSRVFAELKEGSFVGEMALIFQTNRTASVRAQGYCDVYVLTKRSFDFILKKHPSFEAHMREIATARQSEARQRNS